MWVCVWVGSYCGFLALLEHSLPPQHPLHCDCSRIQVNCKLFWLCWATTGQRQTLQAIHTKVHRGKHAFFFCTDIPDQLREKLVIIVDSICKATLIPASSISILHYQLFLFAQNWISLNLNIAICRKNSRNGHGAVQIVCLENQSRKLCAGT